MSPDAFALDDCTVAEIARLVGATFTGRNDAILHLRPASAVSVPRATLGYTDGTHLEAMETAGFAAAITPRADRHSSLTLIEHPEPARAFFAVHTALATNGRYRTLQPRRRRGSRLAASAVVHDSVWIGSGVSIGPNAHVGENTILGDGVVVGPGAVLGGDGFQVASGPDGRFPVPHIGALVVGDNVRIGANTTIDRSLHSDASVIGRDTMVDNLTYVAHNVRIGERATIAARVAVMGSVEIGDDAWVGPGVTINQHHRIGAGALIGSGAVVVRSVPDHAVAYGNPARVEGSVCLCRRRLPADGTCEVCGYEATDTAGVPAA